MLRNLLKVRKLTLNQRFLSSNSQVPKQVVLSKIIGTGTENLSIHFICAHTIQARAVVIGGGIIGNSVAYHLAKLGMKDVVLLEQQQVTAGTTWHAAGLMVTFGSMNETSTDMRKYTRKLYSELEAETGQATGFKPVGKCLSYQTRTFNHSE